MGISEPERIILDSSVWIAFFREIDSQRGKALRVLAGLQEAEIVVPEYVLVEVATALKSKGYVSAAKQFVAEVMRDDRALLPSSEPLVQATAETFLKRERDGLSFTDTALLVLSKRYRIITFDRHLQKAINKTRA